MRWPWNNRRKDEELKRKLSATAQQRINPPAPAFPSRSQAAPISEPEPADPMLAQPTNPEPKPIEATAEIAPVEQLPLPELAPASTNPSATKPQAAPQPTQAAVKRNGNGNGNGNGYHHSGADLTLYFSRRSKRAIGLGGRPRPRGSWIQRAVTYIGRDLTIHHNRRGKQLSLISPEVQRPSIMAAIWGTIVYLLKWFFIIRPKILIIERYIWAECWGNFLLGSMGFTFFMIITTIFALGEKIFQKNIPPFTIVKVLTLTAPGFLVLAIPVAVVFSSLMAMNRLNRDNELTAFNTTGISLYRIMIPFLSLGIFAGLLTWVVYEHVVPPNSHEYKEVLKVFWEAQVVDFIKPGIVIKAPEKKYFYVEEIRKEQSENEFGTYQRSVMVNVRLYDYYSDSPGGRRMPRIFVAKRAWVENDFLVLSEVRLYNLDEEFGNTLISASMPEIKIDIGTRTREYSIEPQPAELTAMELRSRVQMLRDRVDAMPFRNPEVSHKYLRNQTEYYFKYSIPMACVAFALICVPVMIRGPRDERNLGLIMTFVVTMSYYIIFFICRTVGSRGMMLSKDFTIMGHKLLAAGDNMFPPMIAGWLAPAVFFAAAGVLLWRVRK